MQEIMLLMLVRVLEMSNISLTAGTMKRLIVATRRDSRSWTKKARQSLGEKKSSPFVARGPFPGRCGRSNSSFFAGAESGQGMRLRKHCAERPIQSPAPIVIWESHWIEHPHPSSAYAVLSFTSLEHNIPQLVRRKSLLICDRFGSHLNPANFCVGLSSSVSLT
jgi:hypothetical protein